MEDFTMSTENRIRYYIEHILTRSWFFEEGEQFASFLGEQGHVYPQMVRRIYEKNEVEFPYEDDDFAVRMIKVAEDIYCICIMMPEPEKETDCLYIMMFFDENFSRRAYFTIERGFSLFEGQQLTYCCEWKEDGEHLSYGQCSDDIVECLQRCAEVFLAEETEN